MTTVVALTKTNTCVILVETPTKRDNNTGRDKKLDQLTEKSVQGRGVKTN